MKISKKAIYNIVFKYLCNAALDIVVVIMNKNKNTIYVKKSTLDQFYTHPDIAKLCLDKLDEDCPDLGNDRYVEPSAGNGSFYNFLPDGRRIGIDLEPKCDGVIEHDYLTYKLPESKQVTKVVGNPPFGKIAALAIKFFNKAASDGADSISFIIPKTFRKISVQKKLDKNFILLSDIDLPKNAFILNGEPYDVPCCFQTWIRSYTVRVDIEFPVENQYIEFCKKENADLVVRRVGGRSGKASNYVELANKNSNYFIRILDKRYSLEKYIDMINTIDFSDIVNSTAGVRSLSKPELIKKFLEILDNDKTKCTVLC